MKSHILPANSETPNISTAAAHLCHPHQTPIGPPPALHLTHRRLSNSFPAHHSQTPISAFYPTNLLSHPPTLLPTAVTRSTCSQTSRALSINFTNIDLHLLNSSKQNNTISSTDTVPKMPSFRSFTINVQLLQQNRSLDGGEPAWFYTRRHEEDTAPLCVLGH